MKNTIGLWQSEKKWKMKGAKKMGAENTNKR